MTKRASMVLAAVLVGGALVWPGSAASAADCSGDTTSIPTIQGSGATAAVTGSVTVTGVVVGDEEGPAPALRGFYLQDPKGDGDRATSDGIFVFEGDADTVTVGRKVQVTGTVAEFQGQTQITSTTVTDCGTGTVRPAAVTLPVASTTDLERYEGMLVRFPQKLAVTEHFQLGRFGQVTVSAGGRQLQPTNVYPAADPRRARLQDLNSRSRILVDDDRNNQNPDPIVFGRGGQPLSASNTLRAGDTLSGAVGVLTYTWAGNAASGNAYRLRPIGALGGRADFRAANPRTATPPVGSTRVASANLLNYFVRTSGCTLGVAGAATECRGANNATELARQQAKEVAALRALDADVIGVMEVANDGYGAGSSIADLTGRLASATGKPWTSVDPDAALGATDVAGDDAIKVGLLYRSDRVTPTRTLVDTAFDGYDRRPLATTFRRGGATFSVVVNHFKSKGCDGATGADADTGDGQGCWNARRVAQAKALSSWVRQAVVPAAKDPDVLVIGDLNAYAEEDPVHALESAGYRNQVQRFGGPAAYSYGFDGQWGYLDQALASAGLASQVTGVHDVHINADEPSVLDYNTEFKSAAQVDALYAPDRFRTSDHDPVLIGLSLRR